jgi:cold shock CspA family protein
MIGTIYKLYSNNGYGFIRGDNGDTAERFFHAKWCKPLETFSRLKEGDKVEFVPDDKGKGGNQLQAKEVTKLS